MLQVHSPIILPRWHFTPVFSPQTIITSFLTFTLRCWLAFYFPEKYKMIKREFLQTPTTPAIHLPASSSAYSASHIILLMNYPKSASYLCTPTHLFTHLLKDISTNYPFFLPCLIISFALYHLLAYSIINFHILKKELLILLPLQLNATEKFSVLPPSNPSPLILS